MATIKQLTTEALQEVEDGKVYDALRTIIAAIEELDDEVYLNPGFTEVEGDVYMDTGW